MGPGSHARQKNIYSSPSVNSQYDDLRTGKNQLSENLQLILDFVRFPTPARNIQSLHRARFQVSAISRS